MTEELKGILEIKEDLHRELLDEIIPELKKEMQNQMSGLADMLRQQPQHSATQPLQQAQPTQQGNMYSPMQDFFSAMKTFNDLNQPESLESKISTLKSMQDLAKGLAPEGSQPVENAEDKIFGKILDLLISQKQAPPQTPQQTIEHTPSKENEPKTEEKLTSREEIKQTIEETPENQLNMIRSYAENESDENLLDLMDQAGFRIKPEDLPYAKECIGIKKKKAKGEGKK